MKKTLSLAVLIAVLATGNVFAQSYSMENDITATLNRIEAMQQAKGGEDVPYYGNSPALNDTDREHSSEIGLEVSHFSYEEPGVNVKDEGMMYGVKGAYNYRPQEGNPLSAVVNVYHVDARVAYGQLDYEGSGTSDNNDNYVGEARVWLGHDFASDNGARVTPYVGFGYRTLFDNSADTFTSTGAVGYDRRSQYLYVPAGLELRTPAPADGWQLGLDAEYDYLVKGFQDSYISGLNGGGFTILDDVHNEQEDGYGVRGAIQMIKKGQSMDVSFGPYVRYWNIEDSDIDVVATTAGPAGFYEPQNETTEIGVQAGLKF